MGAATFIAHVRPSDFLQSLLVACQKLLLMVWKVMESGNLQPLISVFININNCRIYVLLEK